MAEYSTMIVTVAIALIFCNVFILYVMDLPGGENGQSLQIGVDKQQQKDLNANTSSFVADLNTISGAVTSLQQKISLDVQSVAGVLYLFPDLLFGLGGIAAALLGNLWNVFAGFTIWIDFLLPPNTPLAIIGLGFKGFFFYIIIYGIYIIVSSLFGLGVGK